MHPDETRLLNKLKQGKSEEEQYRLTAAACALTHCADGVPKSDKYYKVLKDLQTAGEQFTAEKALLQQQGVGLKNGKFQYSFANGGSDDFITRKGKAISKTSAAADTVLGSLGVVGGYTLASVGCAGTMGIGCTPSIIAGAGISTLSLKQAQSGSERLFSTYQSPYGNLVLQSLVEPTEYYSATNNAAGNVALWTAESFALKGLGKVVGVKGVSPSANKSAKTDITATPSANTPVTSNGTANIATGAKLNLDLKTTEAANKVVESLRTTGHLPSHYITQTQAQNNGWKPGKPLATTNPGKQIGGDIYKNDPIKNSNGVTVVPNANGRVWYEADIGISNSISRSKQDGTRLLYSNDGLLYITTDHYQSPAHFIGKWK